MSTVLRSPKLEDYVTKNNLLRVEGLRVYKPSYPGGQNGNPRFIEEEWKLQTGNSQWKKACEFLDVGDIPASGRDPIPSGTERHMFEEPVREQTEPVPSADPAASLPPRSTHFTDFYIKYCYWLLGGLLGLNVVIAVPVFLFAGQDSWLYLVTASVLSLGFLAGLWGFLEDKQKVPLPKRVVTFVLVCTLPLLQVAATHIPKPLEYPTTTDRKDLDIAIAIVRANEYRDREAIEKNALPVLERLGKKYPRTDEILFPLGIARFETQHFSEAAETFATLVDHDSNNFKNHYHLGIAYKRLAEIEDEALQNGKSGAPSATTIAALRGDAMNHLRRSLELYKTAFEAEGYYWWRLQRNIGWLEYELSNRCADRLACVRAIDTHRLALNGDSQFSGNPKYILAYNNIGWINHRMGNDAEAERVLHEAIDLYQTMLRERESDAWKLENRYVYTLLAALLFSRHQTDEVFSVLTLATSVFPLDAFKNDGLNPAILAQLRLAASQPHPIAPGKPRAADTKIERD